MLASSQVYPDLEGDDLVDNFLLSIGRLLGKVHDPSGSTGFNFDATGSFLDSLNSGLRLAVRVRFTGMSLSHIDAQTVEPHSGSTIKALTVHLDLNHPYDPAPRLLDPPRSDLSPDIQLDRPRAYLKDTVHVHGRFWQYTPWDKFFVYFSKATSGDWKQTEIQHGIIPPGQNRVSNATSTTITHLYPTRDDDSFEISNLPPNTHIGYRVRGFDLPGFACTQWTPWIGAWTATRLAVSISVYIRLDNCGLEPLDTSEIEVQPDGSIDGTIDLPGTAPLFSPSQHEIVARMSVYKEVTASTYITIDDDSGRTPPRIQLLNLFNQPNGNETVGRMLRGPPNRGVAGCGTRSCPTRGRAMELLRRMRNKESRGLPLDWFAERTQQTTSLI
jgi:hypothetical protein